jgi:hypothetical protein
VAGGERCHLLLKRRSRLLDLATGIKRTRKRVKAEGCAKQAEPPGHQPPPDTTPKKNGGYFMRFLAHMHILFDEPRPP